MRKIQQREDTKQPQNVSYGPMETDEVRQYLRDKKTQNKEFMKNTLL